MNISVILAHPYEKSFNHAICKTVLEYLHKKEHNVFYHNLYEEGFNPLLDGIELSTGETSDSLVLKHRQEIQNADGVIIIHPNWWGQPPAILKGWMDRVLRSGIAYAFEEGDDGSGIPEGLLNAKIAIVFNTSNTPKEREMDVFGDPLERIWRDCVFDFCGIQNFHRRMFRVVASSTPQKREKWLNDVKRVLSEYF